MCTGPRNCHFRVFFPGTKRRTGRVTRSGPSFR